jgi:hypothetical protein
MADSRVTAESKSRHGENCATAIARRASAGSRTAVIRCAIEHAVYIKQRSVSPVAVRAAFEAVKHLFLAGRGDAEDHAAASGTGDYRACGARAALLCGTVQRTLDVGQVPEWTRPIIRGTVEAVYGVERAGPAEGENRPASTAACFATTPGGHAVQRSINVDQAPVRVCAVRSTSKAYSTFSLPDVLMLKAVPHPTGPLLLLQWLLPRKAMSPPFKAGPCLRYFFHGDNEKTVPSRFAPPSVVVP